MELTKNFGLSDWKDLLRQLLLGCGLEDKQLVFLFCDTQITNDVFLENVSNLLNSSDVPNLFDGNDLEQIYNHMRPICMYERLPTTKTGCVARALPPRTTASDRLGMGLYDQASVRMAVPCRRGVGTLPLGPPPPQTKRTIVRRNET